jgi:beta-lactamase class D
MPKSLNRAASGSYRRFVAALLLFFFASCSTNNVTVDDSLQKYFDSAGVKGDFGLFDNGQGHFTIYNLPRFRDSAYLPAATFDIVQSLIALQTGVLTNDTSVVFLDYGEFVDNIDTAIAMAQHPDTTGKLMRKTTLREIFQGHLGEIGSMQLAGLIGKDTLKKWVDSLHYGNRDISEMTDSNRISGRLKITSDEQLGLIKKLYFDQLPFFRRPQELVRKMMLSESNSNYKLVYKTGQGTRADKQVMGWVMGWVEENKHPYFFVLNLESADPRARLDTVGLHIVKNILRPMGFFAGHK